MVPERGSPSTRGRSPSRRSFLAGVAAASGVASAGCAQFPSTTEPEGEGDAVEVIVTNSTADVAHVAVRIEDEAGEALLERVYEVQPGHTDESAGVDARPATVFVFTRDGLSATWEYDPDLDLDCDGEDIGIRLTEDGGIESWYAC